MKTTIAGIEVDLQRKKMKTLRMTVLPPDGRVRVSAPTRIARARIEEFVRSRLDWIAAQRLRIIEQSPVPIQYVTGERLTLFGQLYTLRVEHGHRKNCLVLSGSDAFLFVRRESTAEQRARVVNEWYRDRLREQVDVLLPKWEQITALHASSWQSKRMTTRWGTCNTGTKKIWLNLALAQKPLLCLEYVILHELVHTRVPNHGKDFVALMDRFMPDWRDRKKCLNLR